MTVGEQQAKSDTERSSHSDTVYITLVPDLIRHKQLKQLTE